MYRHLLIPTDGSSLSDEAVTYGVRLAASMGAAVTFLTVTDPFHIFSFEADQLEDTPDTYRAHMKERAAKILAKTNRAAETAGIVHDAVHVEEDQPYEAIIRTAREKGCDLILMASHGRRGFSALVLGSETVKVLTHSATPVLVYRSSAAQPDMRWSGSRETAYGNGRPA